LSYLTFFLLFGISPHAFLYTPGIRQISHATLRCGLAQTACAQTRMLMMYYSEHVSFALEASGEKLMMQMSEV